MGRARPGRTLHLDDDGTIWCTRAAARPVHLLPRAREDRGGLARDPTGPRSPSATLGRLDDDGYLYLDGRRTDLIISGGVNVYPLEVEQVLGEHPGVDDIAVFGVDDPTWGQRVCAAVVGTRLARPS